MKDEVAARRVARQKACAERPGGHRLASLHGPDHDHESTDHCLDCRMLVPGQAAIDADRARREAHPSMTQED